MAVSFAMVGRSDRFQNTKTYSQKNPGSNFQASMFMHLKPVLTSLSPRKDLFYVLLLTAPVSSREGASSRPAVMYHVMMPYQAKRLNID